MNESMFQWMARGYLLGPNMERIAWVFNRDQESPNRYFAVLIDADLLGVAHNMAGLVKEFPLYAPTWIEVNMPHIYVDRAIDPIPVWVEGPVMPEYQPAQTPPPPPELPDDWPDYLEG
ncbi:hypothetical protein D6833_08275 [Candidatus Parcubacteria bacterium]|nr:MAG: hypothetical protein D6833_08275 [Candidatus Parcubacteria bacterium]